MRFTGFAIVPLAFNFSFAFEKHDHLLNLKPTYLETSYRSLFARDLADPPPCVRCSD